MKWTKIMPTKHGWYFVKFGMLGSERALCVCYMDGAGFFVNRFDITDPHSMWRYQINADDAEFAGPIRIPKENKEP